MNTKMTLITLLNMCIAHSTILNLNSHNLDRIALQKTDKSSEIHNYTPIYDSYFSQIKDSPVSMLEIGFAGGGSARMWDEYFTHPKTKLYFIDNNSECFQYTNQLSSRCKLFLGDQENRSILLSILDEIDSPLDIIIDDGGHTMTQQKISFETLFPYIKSGGVYIIEDLHTSYWEQYGGGGTIANPSSVEKSTTEFLKKLVDDVNWIGAYTGTPNKTLSKKIINGTFTGFGKYNFSNSFFNTLTYYQKHVMSVHFYHSLCFIFKN